MGVLVLALVDGIPFLWDGDKLKRMEGEGRINGEFREMIMGSNSNLCEMYNIIMGVLVSEHGDIFGEPVETATGGSDSNEGGNNTGGGRVSGDTEKKKETEVWMNSFEKI